MFMSACRVHARYDEMRDYMMALTVPRSYSSLASLFEAARLRQALRVGKFQCDCSEFMTLAPAIGRYLREVVVHRTDDVRVRSMLAVLDVLEMLPAARTLGAVDHVALGTAIKAHLDANGSDETPAAPSPPHPTPPSHDGAHRAGSARGTQSDAPAGNTRGDHSTQPNRMLPPASARRGRSGLFKEAYGASHMRPKHHYALHLPLQLRVHGFLVATMTMERKHRVLKRYLRPRRTLVGFEDGVMEEITCFELWQLGAEVPHH